MLSCDVYARMEGVRAGVEAHRARSATVRSARRRSEEDEVGWEEEETGSRDLARGRTYGLQFCRMCGPPASEGMTLSSYTNLAGILTRVARLDLASTLFRLNKSNTVRCGGRSPTDEGDPTRARRRPRGAQRRLARHTPWASSTRSNPRSHTSSATRTGRARWCVRVRARRVRATPRLERHAAHQIASSPLVPPAVADPPALLPSSTQTFLRSAGLFVTAIVFMRNFGDAMAI